MIINKRLSILQFSDLHLGRRFKYLSDHKNEQRWQDQKNCLARMIDIAMENNCSILMVPGDLFDPQLPSFSLVEYVRSQFSKFCQGGGHIFLIPGNHERWLLESNPAISILASLPNFHLFNQQGWNYKSLTVDENQIHVYGYPFNPNNPFTHPMETFKKNEASGLHLALIHGSYTEFANPNMTETELYHPITRQEINASGVNYIAFGHYHKTIIVDTKPVSAYAGSPEGTRFNLNEIGPRHALLINVAENGDISVDKKPVNQRQILIKDYEFPKTTVNAVHDELRALANSNTLIRLNLSGVISTYEDLEKLILLPTQFSELFFFIQVNQQDLKVAEALITNIDNQSAEGLFLKAVNKQIAEENTIEEKESWHKALIYGLSVLSKQQ